MRPERKTDTLSTACAVHRERFVEAVAVKWNTHGVRGKSDHSARAFVSLSQEKGIRLTAVNLEKGRVFATRLKGIDLVNKSGVIPTGVRFVNLFNRVSSTVHH